mgnify:CR=1 FL=1
MTRELHGIIAPLTTAFTPEGDVYETGLRALVDFQVAGGAHGLFVCGTYGLGPVMTLDERNPMGALVCAIDGQGCAYPAEDCLCRCRGLGDCAYWASFVRTPPGAWTYAGQGVSAQSLHPGDLYAWVWLPTAESGAALEWLPTGGIADLCP